MPPKAFKGEYIETDTGNKISRRAQIHGTQRIILGGKTVIQSDAVIRGDLYRSSSSSAQSADDPAAAAAAAAAPSPSPSVAINIGRYSYISKQAILRPPSRLHRGVHSYYPLKIGDHVFVGERAVVEAASVGNHVHIGKEVVLGGMAILKDFAVVLDGAVVPAGMVVPSWCVVGGRPARILGEVGEGYGVEGAEGGLARERYRLVGRSLAGLRIGPWTDCTNSGIAAASALTCASIVSIDIDVNALNSCRESIRTPSNPCVVDRLLTRICYSSSYIPPSTIYQS